MMFSYFLGGTAPLSDIAVILYRGHACTPILTRLKLKDPTGVSGFGDMECPKPNPWILSLFIPIFVLFSMKIVLKM